MAAGGRFEQRALLGLALFWTLRMGDFEFFSVLCYRDASRLEEVLSTRWRVEDFITLSAGLRRLRSG